MRLPGAVGPYCHNPTSNPMISPSFFPSYFMLRRCAGVLVILAAALTLGKAAATDASERYFKIESGEASTTLGRFAEQARTQVVYLADDVRGIKTRAVEGQMTSLVALQRMVEGTVLLGAKDDRTGALTVRRNTISGAAADGGGTISGIVSSLSTKNLLEGASVDISGLNRRVLTDRSGRFTIPNVEQGAVTLRIAYLGFDPVLRSVHVTAGKTTELEIELGSEVLQLSQFVVQTEREGQALALTSQRNASNLKTVVALDALGNLPNLSAGELAARLPGVAPLLDNEDNITGVAIRGSPPGMNRVTVDGDLIANSGGYSRSFQMHSMTGAMFEELELIKGQTPDRSADSVGGGINLKTRSPLAMKEKRRINYSLGARWASPLFDEYTSVRRAHPIHPLLNVAYQEVFSLFGGDRNLGLALNAFYSENVNSPNQTILDYQNTAADPAYVWDYRTLTRFGARRQASINLKAEYRLSPTTKIIANGIYNDANEAFNREFSTRAFSNQTVATLDATGQPTGTGAVTPGYTPTATTVRPVTGSIFELTTIMQSFFNRTRMASFGAEHRFDRLDIDYTGSFSRAHANLGHGDDGSGGSLVMRVTPIGWRLDTTNQEKPVFTQTSGASIYDVTSYNNSVQDTLRDSDRDVDIWTGKLDLKYRPQTIPYLNLKGGLYYRDHGVAERARNRRWSYTNAQPLPAGTPQRTAEEERTGMDLPFVDASNVRRDLGNSALWVEDLYFQESQKFSLSTEGTEKITAAYIMAQGRWNQFSALAGVRGERTSIRGSGYVRVAPATAVQIPDPIARANNDWNHPTSNQGSYTRWFPSAHFVYDLTPEVKIRGSWSTSFGRPDFLNLLPAATINEAQSLVTISNPALGPQYATNIDTSIEYYFKPAGLLSVGYFNKRIEDFILARDIGIVGAGEDNGFDGAYSGYTLRSQTNGGSARITGWEFDYRQQLNFLPGTLRGLTASANFTYLVTKGDFGGATNRSSSEVAGFIPKTANGSLTYKFRRFGARVLVSYTSGYLGTDAAQLQRRIFRDARTVVNAGLSYELRPALNFFCDVTNLFNEPQRTYRGFETRLERIIYNGPALSLGVTGRF